MVCVYLHSFNKNNIIQEESVKEQSCFAASLIALSATRQPTTDYPLCFLLTLYVNDDVKWSIKHSPGQQLLCLKKSCFKIPTTYGLGHRFSFLIGCGQFLPHMSQPNGRRQGGENRGRRKKNVLRQTDRDGHSAITLTLKLFGLSSVWIILKT